MYASNSTNWNENVLISLQIEFCLNIMYVPMWSHHKPINLRLQTLA